MFVKSCYGAMLCHISDTRPGLLAIIGADEHYAAAPPLGWNGAPRKKPWPAG
jgi:hypothetical protein